MGFSPGFSFMFLIFLFIPIHSQHDDIFYAGFKDAGANLTLDGAAKISNNGILQLTNETSRLKGHAFYSSPFHFKNSANGSVLSFSTSFAFAIVPEYAQLGGHGMAFTVAPSTDLSDALPSQYLGLMNSIGNFSNHVFAVEFDTVKDFEFGDINDNHVGIDVNSLVSNASTNGSYYTDNSTLQQLSFKDGKVIQAWIAYDSVTNLINVTISPFSSKPKIPILSFHFDLSPIFNEYMYVGFSSSTGLLASSHYIMGWRFEMNGVSSSLDLSSLPSLPGPKKKHTVLITAVSLSCVLLAVVLISISLFLKWKIKKADVIEDWELVTGPHRFKYKELKQATKGFKDKELLGCGGFGRVYKGKMPNSKIQVAVKRISHESRQGLREFASEIASIGRLRHRNLVQLLGWCRRRGDLLLVYDFMANGSLDKYLFDEPQMILSWKQRFNIIKGVASGLLYLHEGYDQVVIHRDVKASNVLLDEDFNGKLGDFGLARLYEHGANPSTTRVVGTLGYISPELPRTGKANTGSDVFAFGALLLEVACGRRPIEPSAKPEELVLVDWVWDKWRQGKFLEVVDERLKGEYEESEVLMVLKLGLMCSSSAAAMRPSMRQVVRYLEGEVGVPEVLRVPNEFTEEEGEAYEDLMGSFETVTFPTSPLSLPYGRRVTD